MGSDFEPSSSLDQLIQLGAVTQIGGKIIKISAAYEKRSKEQAFKMLDDPKVSHSLYEKYPDPIVAATHLETQVDIITIMEIMGGGGNKKEILAMATVLGQMRDQAHQ